MTASTSSYPTTATPTTDRVINLKVSSLTSSERRGLPEARSIISSFSSWRIDDRRHVERTSTHDKIPKCNDPSELADLGATGRTTSNLVSASSTQTPMDTNPLRWPITTAQGGSSRRNRRTPTGEADLQLWCPEHVWPTSHTTVFHAAAAASIKYFDHRPDSRDEHTSPAF